MTNTARDDWSEPAAASDAAGATAEATRSTGHLTAVPEAPTPKAGTTGADVLGAGDLSFAPGFVRAVLIGALLGFLVVAALAAVAVVIVTPYGIPTAVAVGAFVGAFGGVGFGGMVAASVHR